MDVIGAIGTGSISPPSLSILPCTTTSNSFSRNTSITPMWA